MRALMSRDSRVIHTSSLQLWGSASCVTHIVRICTPSLVHSAVLFMRVHKRPDILLLLRGVRHMVTAHETLTLSPGSTGKSVSRSWWNRDTASYRCDGKMIPGTVINDKIVRFKSIKWKSRVGRKFNSSVSYNTFLEKPKKLILKLTKNI